jgi:hypothetical protein
MFENFKAYNDSYNPVEYAENAIYLVIFNEKGYEDAIKWITEEGTEHETALLKEAESCYYQYDAYDCLYRPINENCLPAALFYEFNAYHNKEKKTASNSSQKFKIKIQLVNGITIEPNLYSNDFHEITDIIQELSCEKLFAGQIKNIKIE